MDCSVIVVRGNIKHNNITKGTKFKFSSDDDPKVTYKCKLDDKN